MTSLELLLRHPLVPALGWALLHFLWQGALVAGLLALALGFREPRGAPFLRSSEARYLASCLALLLMASCPLITMTVSVTDFGHWTSPAAVEMASADAGHARSHIVIPPSVSTSPPSRPVAPGFEPLLPAVVGAWLLGVVLLSLRLLGGWLAVQRLARRDTHPVAGPARERFLELASRLKIARPVRLLESPWVSVPTVVGWLRAAVLVPGGALSGLPPAHLEAVLAHELAHVRRHDYLINLLQTAVETLLFYHPAVWWVSRCIRREREHCCDDIAVALLGDRLTYARALTALEERRHAPALALAAGGGDLMGRIRRILDLPTASPGPSAAGIGGLIVLTLILAAAVLQASAAPASSTAKLIRPEAPIVTASASDVERASEKARLQRLRAMAEAQRARAALFRQNREKAARAAKARQTSLQRARLEAIRAVARLAQLRRAQAEAARAERLRRTRSSQPRLQKLAANAPSRPPAAGAGAGTAPAAKGAATAVKTATSPGSGIVKGVPGATIEDVAILDLRGVPADQVARIQSVKDVAVLLLDAKNRTAFRPAKVEDVGATVVAGPNARVLVEPVLEFSRATLAAMPARQELVLVGVVIFKPDVTPAQVTQKLASLHVTGVLLATEAVRGALLAKLQMTGSSATLPADAGPVAHSVGHNELTTGYLSRLPDRSVYVNVGAVQIAADVSEELLARKIGAYVNIGATIGPMPLLDRLKSVSIANIGAFTTDDEGDEEDEDKDTE